MQRKIPSPHDYISNLPQSIIEIIFTKLPLKDAVRTSILSSKWRYKWATLTDLEFNDKCVSQTQELLANLINRFLLRFLLLHEGPINKFVLSTAKLNSSPDLHQWLLFLSRKDVKELVLNLSGSRWFKAPSCLFSCQKLVSLELCMLTLNPPLSFEGFPFMKHLNLQQVYIAPVALQSLISSCPLLETLNLWYYDSLELTIRAPNLKFLILKGDIKDTCLENTPKLVSLTVTYAPFFDQSSSCNLDKFLGGVPSLQRLIGHRDFTKYMSIGNNTFGKTEMKYEQLKVIELSQVSFKDVKEVMVVLRLISNAPNLQQLQISSSSNSPHATEASDLDFWEKEWLFDCTFERLKTVKMMGMSGVPHEVKFIGFLLGNSPVLETISITQKGNMIEDKFSFLTKLTKFPRISMKAEMTFV